MTREWWREAMEYFSDSLPTLTLSKKARKRRR